MSALDSIGRIVAEGAVGVSQIADQVMRQPLHTDLIFVGMAFTTLGSYYIAEKAAQLDLPAPMSLVRVFGCGLLGAATYGALISIGFTHTMTGVAIGACLGFGLHFALALALARPPSGVKNVLALSIARILVGGIAAILLTLTLIIGAIVYWIIAHTILPMLRGVAKTLALIGMGIVFVVIAILGFFFWELQDWYAKRTADDGRSGIGATLAAPYTATLTTTIAFLWAILTSERAGEQYRSALKEGVTLALVFLFIRGCIGLAALLAAIIVDVLSGRVVGAESRPLLVNGAAGQELLTTPINPTVYALLVALVLGLISGVVTAIVHKIGLLSASRFLVGFVAGLALGPFHSLSGAGAWAMTTIAVIAICLGVQWLAARARQQQALFGASLMCLGALIFMLPYVGPLR